MRAILWWVMLGAVLLLFGIYIRHRSTKKNAAGASGGGASGGEAGDDQTKLTNG